MDIHSDDDLVDEINTRRESVTPKQLIKGNAQVITRKLVDAEDEEQQIIS